jgi:hypothetical protein
MNRPEDGKNNPIDRIQCQIRKGGNRLLEKYALF